LDKNGQTRGKWVVAAMNKVEEQLA
jgi:hypothetical protein